MTRALGMGISTLERIKRDIGARGNWDTPLQKWTATNPRGVSASASHPADDVNQALNDWDVGDGDRTQR